MFRYLVEFQGLFFRTAKKQYTRHSNTELVNRLSRSFKSYLMYRVHVCLLRLLLVPFRACIIGSSHSW